MKRQALMGFAAISLVVGLSAPCWADDARHSPDAHMDQNADRYRYDYDDGVCNYHYEYDFKTLKDRLEQKGDCRNVPIQRYRPQAAIVPAYPPPGAAPPAIAPSSTATMPQPAPSVIVGQPAPQAGSPSVIVGTPSPAPAPRAPAGIAVTPVP